MAASADFEKVLVKDDRLMVTDRLKYAVLKGGQNVTCQSFKAISATPKAHTFNVSVPSLETIISREIVWTCDLTLRIECKRDDVPSLNYIYPVNHGVTDALGPFPLHQLAQTMTATINNNNSVSMHVHDVFLRFCEWRIVMSSQCTTVRRQRR